MKHYKSLEIFSIFKVSTPPHKPKAPPQKRKVPLLKTFWRRFWFNIKQTARSGDERLRQSKDNNQTITLERKTSLSAWCRWIINTNDRSGCYTERSTMLSRRPILAWQTAPINRQVQPYSGKYRHTTMARQWGTRR